MPNKVLLDGGVKRLPVISQAYIYYNGGNMPAISGRTTPITVVIDGITLVQFSTDLSQGGDGVIFVETKADEDIILCIKY